LTQRSHLQAQKIIARGPSDFRHPLSLGFGRFGYLFLYKNCISHPLELVLLGRMSIEEIFR